MFRIIKLKKLFPWTELIMKPKKVIYLGPNQTGLSRLTVNQYERISNMLQQAEDCYITRHFIVSNIEYIEAPKEVTQHPLFIGSDHTSHTFIETRNITKQILKGERALYLTKE